MDESSAAALDARFRDGLERHRQGRLGDAESIYQAVLREQPAHAGALHYLGVIALQTGAAERAVALIGQAIALNPHDVAAYNNRGNALRRLGRVEEALAGYDLAIAVRPDHAETHDNRGNALRELGRPAEALASHDRSIALNPNAAGAHINRGNALRDLGRLDEAVASYDRAISVRPDDAIAHHNRGVALAELGRPESALASADRAIALNPRYAEAHRHRADLLRAQGRLTEALAGYDTALAMRPDVAETHNNRGATLADLHRYAEALTSYDTALASRPDHAEALINRAAALLRLDRPVEALASCDTAIARRPDAAEAHNTRGMVLAALSRHDEAVASYDRSLALRPGHANAHANRGAALAALGREAAALAGYTEALRLNPTLAAAHAGMGAVLRDLGRIDEAIGCFERAIAQEPRRPEHYALLTGVSRLREDSPHLRAMLSLADEITGTAPGQDEANLRFALGKALGDIGQHQQAFEHQLAANALRRRRVTYDEATELGRIERARTVFSPAFMRSRAISCSSAAPIFIVGMPRSGSTLVEQILASHPNVFGAGEIDDFVAAGRTCGLFTAEKPFPDSVPAWTDAQLRGLGSEYTRRTSALAADQAPDKPVTRITDKMLSNFQYVGLIHSIFPNAGFIHARRDPIDTCLSCFSIQFQSLDFCHDLAELGRRHAACSRLMRHWRSVLPPGVMLEVHYEHLIENFDAEARRIVAHCGLAWDDACARFHETPRTVRTSSAAQVRQPLYRNVRWRPDLDTLRPLLDALGIEP